MPTKKTTSKKKAGASAGKTQSVKKVAKTAKAAPEAARASRPMSF